MSRTCKVKPLYHLLSNLLFVTPYELWLCKNSQKVPTWFHSQITEELESVKAQMDERGTNMTDAGKFFVSFQIATSK